MSEPPKPAARRSGAAAGTRSNRAGRLDGRAWRDVERALRLGKKHDAHAVEVHRVRVVFKGAILSPQETTGGRVRKQLASRQEHQPTSASASRRPQQPNSAQRRSARRLEDFLKKKESPQYTEAVGPPAAATPASGMPAPVEADVRMADGAQETAEAGRSGRKRVAGETPAHAQPTSTLPQSSPRATRSSGSTSSRRRAQAAAEAEALGRRRQRRCDASARRTRSSRDARPQPGVNRS